MKVYREKKNEQKLQVQSCKIINSLRSLLNLTVK